MCNTTVLIGSGKTYLIDQVAVVLTITSVSGEGKRTRGCNLLTRLGKDHNYFPYTHVHVHVHVCKKPHYNNVCVVMPVGR